MFEFANDFSQLMRRNQSWLHSNTFWRITPNSPGLPLNHHPILSYFPPPKRAIRRPSESSSSATPKKIFHSTLRITRNREDAEDALQDCFVSGLVHLNDFDGRSQLSTWLTRIAINAALMKLRRTRYSKEVSMEFVDEEGKERPRFQLIDCALNPEDTFVEQERAKILHEALGGLRPRVRAAIEICQLQECSVRETARKLGISTAAAKGRLFHARVALRKACTQKTNPAFARRLRRAA